MKSAITWSDAVEGELRICQRLFAVSQPGTVDKDFLEELNADSLKMVTAFV